MYKERLNILKNIFQELLTKLEINRNYSIHVQSPKGTHCWNLYFLILDLRDFQLVNKDICKTLIKLEEGDKESNILCVQIIKNLNLIL